jgi:hypothetical protein
VRTIHDLLPDDFAAKNALVRELRGLVSPRNLEDLPAPERDLVNGFITSQDLKPISETDLPEGLLVALRERDGSLGKMVLVYPKVNGEALWDGDRLAQLVGALRSVAASAVPQGHNAGRVAGGLPLSADILGAVRDDGLTTCVVAFCGVIFLVLTVVRRRVKALAVIGALATGVLFQVAAMMGFHLKLNFANFIALPITFGVGVDYAVNVVTRYLSDGARDVEGAVASTGGAVVLCSLTTIIGYASLLVAKNQALFLFGALAVLGEICCLVVAIVVLPAVLLLVQRPAVGHDQSQVTT